MATFETSGFNPRATNGSALDFMNMNPYAQQANPATQQQTFPFQTQPFQTQFQQNPWQQAFPQANPWQQQFGGFPQGTTPWNVGQQSFGQQQPFSAFAQQQHPFSAFAQQQHPLLSAFAQQHPVLSAAQQQYPMLSAIAQQQHPLLSAFAQGTHPFQGSQGIGPFGGSPTQGIGQFGGSPMQGIGQFGGSPMQSIGQTPVVTTRSVELSVKVPLHRLVGKHPQEVIQYLTYAVLPVLLDGLVKRAMQPDVGISTSTDLRGECVAEIRV